MLLFEVAFQNASARSGSWHVWAATGEDAFLQTLNMSIYRGRAVYWRQIGEMAGDVWLNSGDTLQHAGGGVYGLLGSLTYDSAQFERMLAQRQRDYPMQETEEKPVTRRLELQPQENQCNG